MSPSSRRRTLTVHGGDPCRLAGRALAILSVLLAFLAVTPPVGAAQEGQVAGRVVNEAGQPVVGARVSVQGTTRSVVTDADGRFRLGGLPGAQVTLQVDRIGHTRVTRSVRVGDTNVSVTLAEAALVLDALVVTGAPGGTERRALGNAISTIDAAQVVNTQPINNVQELLIGRTPGVTITPATGMVGGGSRIRVRGVSSLSLAQEPLIYVDGVRLNNQAATGPINQGFGSNSISRFNDLNPAEIESIEIIRGPAAATLYGTEASNGVVQIITKRGAVGATTWDFSMRQGAIWFGNAESRVYTNWGELNLPGGRRDTTTINLARLERERGNPIWTTGHLQTYNAALSGGSPAFRYYIGGSMDRDRGAEEENTLSRWNSRVNVTAQPSSDVDVRASVSYLDGRIQLPLEAGGGGRAWSAYFANPARLFLADGVTPHPARGHHSATPEAYQHAYEYFQEVSRAIGSVEVNHRPTYWLAHRLAVGMDVTTEENVQLIQRIEDPAMQFFFGASTIAGERTQTNRSVRYGTFDYSATASFIPVPDLTSSSTFGTQVYRNSTDWVWARGRDFPVRGVTAIGAAAVRESDQDMEKSTTVGIFGQQQFGWRNRVFLTGALRADDNSAFGSDFELAYYPKLSLAWVVSEEPFFPLAAMDLLKLRAAYGETGQQPQTFAAIPTYRGVAGPGDVGTVTPNFIGNPGLGPERGKELELGFDAAFFGNRLGLDFTFYDQRITDAILDREVAPSTGFPSRQFINAGTILNRGVEMSLRALAFETRNANLDLLLNVSTNQNRIEDLGVEGLTWVQAGGAVRHAEGYPAGSWFDRRLLGAQFDENGRLIAGSEICDDGSGGQRPCAGAPAVFLGRPTPAREISFMPALTVFQQLRLGALVDRKSGYHKLDGNMRVRCALFFRCHENWYPEQYVDDPAWLAQTQTGTAFTSGLIHDASFTRLREVSATYSLPETMVRRFGASRASVSVAGRNLYTWTSYPGMEPEASFLGGSRGGASAQWEQNVLPQLQQFVTTVNLTF
jgi:TonB-linked SusC/RagA family outer membrane protein